MKIDQINEKFIKECIPNILLEVEGETPLAENSLYGSNRLRTGLNPSISVPMITCRSVTIASLVPLLFIRLLPMQSRLWIS